MYSYEHYATWLMVSISCWICSLFDTSRDFSFLHIWIEQFLDVFYPFYLIDASRSWILHFIG
jgi:hypothetical protein